MRVLCSIVKERKPVDVCTSYEPISEQISQGCRIKREQCRGSGYLLSAIRVPLHTSPATH